MHVCAVSAVNTRAADLVDLFRSPSEPGTKNSTEAHFMQAGPTGAVTARVNALRLKR